MKIHSMQNHGPFRKVGPCRLQSIGESAPGTHRSDINLRRFQQSYLLFKITKVYVVSILIIV